MKKDIFLYAITFFLVLFCSNLSAQQRETVPVKLKPVSDRLYEILGGRGANGGLYIGDNGVLVIDAKMDKQSVDETMAAIKKITDKPIKYLFNTHSDGDHIGGNRFFPPAITFIAHENCRKEFFHPGRDGEPSEWNLPDRAPFVLSITFRDKMDIYLGSKMLELWYFGVGHTTGDAVVYFPEEKTAFLGDQIFVGRAQLIHSYKGGNSFVHVKTLEKMLETLNDAEKFCSGHADIIDRLTVTAHINEMKIRQEKIKSFVKAGKTLEEIKTEFPEKESGLVEAIFYELTGMK